MLIFFGGEGSFPDCCFFFKKKKWIGRVYVQLWRDWDVGIFKCWVFFFFSGPR
jgi:hypothetical protein